MSQDECAGGSITWGRGEGQAYRDLAEATFGATYDVCTNTSEGYKPFLGTLISDIAALSAPYRLIGAPISTTIKVGIYRAIPDAALVTRCQGHSGQTVCVADKFCAWDTTLPTPACAASTYFEVPRSLTSGFGYNATTNSLAFKSDPVTGACAHTAPCTSQEEIDYARTAPHVPREGDKIFVSYRFWLPVPCNDECLPEQVCVRTYCPDPIPAPAPDCAIDADCPALGQKCMGAPLKCTWDCDPGTAVDLCVCGNCGVCEKCDTARGACALSTTDACECDPRETQCNAQTLEGACTALDIGGVKPCVWSSATARPPGAPSFQTSGRPLASSAPLPPRGPRTSRTCAASRSAACVGKSEMSAPSPSACNSSIMNRRWGAGTGGP